MGAFAVISFFLLLSSNTSLALWHRTPHHSFRTNVHTLNPSRVTIQIAELVSISGASIALEKSLKSFPVDPTISSFVLSALYTISKKGGADSDIIQKLAWSSFLQSSVVLNVFGTEKVDWKTLQSLPILECMVAFLFSSIGSLFGGFVSYLSVARIIDASHSSLSLSSLRAVTASLTASYIGGTANFFEVASVLTKDMNIPDIVNSVAAVDIAFMVIFFQILDFIRFKAVASLSVGTLPAIKGQETASSDTSQSVKSSVHSYNAFSRSVKLILASLLVTQISAKVQRLSPVRGISVMVSILIANVLKYLKPKNGKIRTEFDSLSSKTSLFMLCMFYASIGLNSGLGQIMKTGRAVLSVISINLMV